MRLFTIAVILAVATAVSVPAAAQGTGTSSSLKKPSKKPPAPRLPIGYRAFFLVDTEVMAASQSFTGITGSSTVFGFGGGGAVLNVWKKIFLRGAVSMASTSGERGFVADNVFLSTGVPVDISLRTTELGGGWRMALKKHPKYAISAGGGLLFLSYRDTSVGATTDENVSESFRGYFAHGGVEAAFSKRLTWAAEGQYRTISAPANPKSVQLSYGENNLGGFVIRGMIGVRLGKH